MSDMPPPPPEGSDTPDLSKRPSPADSSSDQGWPGYAAEETPPEPPQTQAYGDPNAGQQVAYPWAPPPGAYGPGYAYAQAHSGATTSMVLGIISTTCAALTVVCCITIVGVPAGPFAIWMALKARKDFEANPGMYNNEGQATAGLVCGIIGTVAGVLAIVATVVFFGFVFSLSSVD